jgi:hypothetical protein
MKPNVRNLSFSLPQSVDDWSQMSRCNEHQSPATPVAVVKLRFSFNENDPQPHRISNSGNVIISLPVKSENPHAHQPQRQLK